MPLQKCKNVQRQTKSTVFKLLGRRAQGDYIFPSVTRGRSKVKSSYLAKYFGSKVKLRIRLIRLVLLNLELVCASIIIPVTNGAEVLEN